MNYNYIRLIPESDIHAGGIKDYGNFKEGFCFKVQTDIPEDHFVPTPEKLTADKSKYVRWIICTPTEAQKQKFMDILIKLKIKNQRSKNLFVEFEKKKDGTIEPLNNGMEKSLMKDLKTGSTYEESKDCKMIVLHPWSECNLACGGGKSYLQLMKVMKTPNGEDCKTKDSILTRDCNMQPCPTVNAVSRVIEKTKKETISEATQTAEVKMMAISQRPTRYDKCHLKEGDALMVKKDESVKEFANFPMVPVRIVMNEKTFTAYQDDNLTNKIVTYLLTESTLYRVQDKKCFILRNTVQEDQFCMLDAGKGDFLEEWDYDYNLFKNQCAKPRVRSEEALEKQKLEKEFTSKVENLKMELVKEQAQKIKAKVSSIEKKKQVNRVDEVRKTSLNAIEKEMKLEDLLEKEEESKEEEETLLLEKQIESEKKKESCFLKAIHEKEIENQYNLAKTKAEKAIEQIAKNTQKHIMEERSNAAKKIAEMRKKQQRKRAQLKSQIMNIRTKIAEKIQSYNRIGDKERCTIKEAAHMIEYCNNNFADNYVKFDECKEKSSFCYVCCENEFGDLHILKREECYNSCDGEHAKQLKPEDGSKNTNDSAQQNKS